MLFTIVKVQKQPSVSVSGWIGIYNGILFKLKRRAVLSFAIWAHCAKWNKPDGEKQIPHDITYMWNLKPKVEFIDTTSRKVVARISGVGEIEISW